MQKIPIMAITSILLLCSFAYGDTKAIVLFEAQEVDNPEDWFGLWHLKPAFADIDVEYHQSSIQKFAGSQLYDMYICYLQDEKLSHWDELFSILYTARMENKKVFFIGNLGGYYRNDEYLGFNEFNRLFNLAGIEDREAWTQELTGIRKKIKTEYFTEDFTRKDLLEQITFHRFLTTFHDGAINIVEAELNGIRYTPVAITPFGGVALFPFLVIQKDNDWKLALNFRKFFRDSLSFDAKKNRSASIGKIVPRKIAVLYAPDKSKGSITLQYNLNLFRQNVQLFLNYHGFTHEYIDYTNPSELARAYDFPIIATVFRDEKVRNHYGVLKLLVDSEAEKYFFIGALPLYDLNGNSKDWNLVEAFFKKFGIEYNHLGIVSTSDEILASSKYHPFETALEKTDWFYAKLIPEEAATKVLTIDSGGEVYSPFFFNSRALFALGDFLFDEKKAQYYFNLFEVFGDFLDPAVIPSYCEGYGYRLAYSHIDGDGFMNSRQETPHIMGFERSAGLLEKTTLPVSASFIVEELMAQAERKGRFYNIVAARKLIDLPHIELASHTLTHPYVWEGGDSTQKTAVGYTYGPVDTVAETRGSLDILSEMFAQDTNLLFFSGNCLPTEEQLRYLREQGILAINGGDTVYNKKTHFLFNVSPPYSAVGKEIQVHTGAANENILTNLWTAPLDGFRKTISTFQNTAKPYLIAPIDIYYHYYSGAPLPAFEALQDVYEFVEKSEISPLFTSEYIELFRDWYDAEIIEQEDRYKIHTNGFLRLVKIKKKRGYYHIDMVRSRGVAGYDLVGDYWNVYLDGSREHTVVFSKNKPRNVFYIQKASHKFSILLQTDEELIYRFHGYGPFRVRFGGLNNRKNYQLTATRGKKTLASVKVIRKDTAFLESTIYGELTVILRPR